MITTAELDAIKRAAADSVTAAQRHERAAAAHERAAHHMAARGGTANTWTVTLANGTTGLWLACGAAVLGLLVALVTVVLSSAALVITVSAQQDMQGRYAQLLVWTQEEARMWRAYVQTGHLQPMRPIPGADAGASGTTDDNEASP